VLVDGEKRKHYDKYGREDADEDFDMEEFMATVFGGSDFTTFLSMMGMFAAAGELDPLAGMQEEDPELVLEEAIDLFLTLHTEKTGKSGTHSLHETERQTKTMMDRRVSDSSLCR
jgi:DnaJ-class molecular chaperone